MYRTNLSCPDSPASEPAPIRHQVSRSCTEKAQSYPKRNKEHEPVKKTLRRLPPPANSPCKLLSEVRCGSSAKLSADREHRRPCCLLQKDIRQHPCSSSGWANLSALFLYGSAAGNFVAPDHNTEQEGSPKRSARRVRPGSLMVFLAARQVGQPGSRFSSMRHSQGGATSSPFSATSPRP